MTGHVHICSAESFMVDAVDITGSCPICGADDVPMKVGWLDIRCGHCNGLFNSESPRRTVKQWREYRGLTVDDMAEKAGVKRSTVLHYESVRPSRRYWNLTVGSKNTDQ